MDELKRHTLGSLTCLLSLILALGQALVCLLLIGGNILLFALFLTVIISLEATKNYSFAFKVGEFSTIKGCVITQYSQRKL